MPTDPNPYQSPDPGDTDSFPPLAVDDRRRLGRCCLFMRVIALSGFLITALAFVLGAYNSYCLIAWDDARYDLLRITRFDSAKTAARGIGYTIVYGWSSFTLWGWTSALRRSIESKCDSLELSARKLAFWRACTLLAFTMFVKSAASYWETRAEYREIDEVTRQYLSAGSSFHTLSVE